MAESPTIKEQTVSFASKSVFSDLGFEQTIALAKSQIQALYLADYLPWVIGYSGGKDSTATLQLVWEAIRELPENKRTKTINVISTDTLVENPIVAMWVENSLSVMEDSARKQRMPVVPNRLTPAVKDSFWVNLIGRGYPAPRKLFRWCTSRLKIEPSNKFIGEMLNQHGEAIVVLGTRSAESNSRKKTMELYAKGSTRSDFNLSRNGNPKLDRCWIYTPVSSWTNDDVWEYLALNDNPWGVPNSDLLAMYRDGTKDRECPLVVDSTTPSCGDSRFGCFVCTLVEKDKSMSAMIQNDEEKKWMQPLSDFRNKWLDISLDKEEGKQSGREREWHKRDFRRMNGSLMLMSKGESINEAELVHGPYRQSYRLELLKAVLQAQMDCRANAPEALSNFRVISMDELAEIRRIWVNEKHEIEDFVPRVYEKVCGEAFPQNTEKDRLEFGLDDLQLLRDICSETVFGEVSGVEPVERSEEAELLYEGVRSLLHVEQNFQRATRRAGVLSQLERVLKRTAWRSEDEARQFAIDRELVRQSSGESSALEAVEVINGDDDLTIFTEDTTILGVSSDTSGGGK